MRRQDQEKGFKGVCRLRLVVVVRLEFCKFRLWKRALLEGIVLIFFGRRVVSREERGGVF